MANTKVKFSNLGIAGKTSIISGSVVLLFFALSSFIFFNLQNNIVNIILTQYTLSVGKGLDEHRESLLKGMNDRLKVTTKICSSISSSFLYNIDPDGLLLTLTPYMSLKEITAIKVLDFSNEPFIAIWKDPEIKSGTALPQSFKGNDQLSATATSHFSQETVGKVRIYFTDKHLQAEINRSKASSEREISSFRETTDIALNKAITIQAVVVIIALFALVSVIVYCLKIVAIRPLSHIIMGMNDRIGLVTQTSTEMSDTAQSLAEASSEQAATVEETSSSLEEISSMTRQNANNSNQADNFMKEVKDIIKQADASMSQLTNSMQQISAASVETSKIIKTIDEIAFQTNLLALNAAVEAARAGEAGAGFAVVADEVRSLAIRAAEAARNTADLIESTILKVKSGAGLVNKTNDDFTKIAKSVEQMGALLGEVAAASSEQADGIENVNIAVGLIDKVAQQNAHHAEQSASSSEEINAQAVEMKKLANYISTLIGGNGATVDGLPVEQIEYQQSQD